MYKLDWKIFKKWKGASLFFEICDEEALSEMERLTLNSDKLVRQQMNSIFEIKKLKKEVELLQKEIDKLKEMK